MVTKQFFVIFSLIILEKDSAKSTNIDVYLEPILDELLLLWDGVLVADMLKAPQAEIFILQAIL